MKKDCTTCLKHDRNRHAEDCLYCMQANDIIKKEARLDTVSEARMKRRERFKAVNKFIEDVLIEKDFVLGDTVSKIHKSIIEVTPDLVKVGVKVCPIASIEEITLELRIEG